MVVVTRAPLGELNLADAAALSPEEVLSRLGSGPNGLSSEDAAERLGQFGANALGTHRVRATVVLFRQLRNPILILLLIAALVSGLTGGGTNAVIIAVIVALSVGLGFFNEYRAEVAMAALRAKIRQEAEVRRDGRESRVPVTNLVPGDVVSLRIGVLVPADIRLLKVDELECDEGVLTGESLPVAKSVEPAHGSPAAGPAGMRFYGNDRPPGISPWRRCSDRSPHCLRTDCCGPGREAGPDRLRGGPVAILAFLIRGSCRADGVYLHCQRWRCRGRS